MFLALLPSDQDVGVLVLEHYWWLQMRQSEGVKSSIWTSSHVRGFKSLGQDEDGIECQLCNAAPIGGRYFCSGAWVGQARPGTRRCLMQI
jgi:hypothetical protein